MKYLIIKTTTTAEGKKSFCYIGLDTDGYQSMGPTPMKVKLLMTKEQANAFAKQYKKWWKVEKMKDKIELKVVSMNGAIKHYIDYMERHKNKFESCTDTDFRQCMKRIGNTTQTTSIPIYF